jgi:hypothetical protein
VMNIYFKSDLCFSKSYQAARSYDRTYTVYILKRKKDRKKMNKNYFSGEVLIA